GGGVERAPSPAQPLDERAQALGLVGEGAGAGEIDDRPESPCEPLDPASDVPLERERGVVQAPLEHGLVAGPHRLRISAVGYERKAVPSQGEVALVRLHRRVDHASRQREEALVERPLENDHLLDEVDDFTELAEGIAPFAKRIEALPDEALTLGRVRLDVGGTQYLRIGLGGGQVDLAVREAVPPCRCAVALHRRSVQAGAGPPDRPRKTESRSVPPHRLAEAEAADDLVQLARQ